jgi:hypothetical protein
MGEKHARGPESGRSQVVCCYGLKWYTIRLVLRCPRQTIPSSSRQGSNYPCHSHILPRFASARLRDFRHSTIGDYARQANVAQRPSCFATA